jgi:hypothetical protein
VADSDPVMPLVRDNHDGQPRRVGVEIELSGLGYAALVHIVAQALQATAREESRYESVIDSDDGPFKVELDSKQVKDFAPDTGVLPAPLAEVTDAALQLLDATAEKIVPLEIVSPPLPLEALPKVETLCQTLRDAGALGSRHALHYAFGLQLNPELPGLDADTLLAYLRAFALSYPWLKHRHQLDISRKFTPYIDAWPEDYVRLILADDYRPDLDRLITDYLHHNPTRNRALDMMPLFAHLDEPRIRNEIDDDRIKPRPTLHYRLPDCDIDNPDWSFSQVWNDWVRVDTLACEPDRLKDMMAAWHARQPLSLDRLLMDWTEESAAWLTLPKTS